MKTAPAKPAAPTAALNIAPERTFLPLIFVQVAFGISEDFSLELIEDGKINPAFNIGSGDGRRDIRITRTALLAFRPEEKFRRAVNLDQEISAAFPSYLSLAPKTTIKGSDLRARLSCSQSHITCLLAEDELILAEPTREKVTPLIFFASVVAFLKRRVI